jgi:hypothetical protein
VNYLRYSFVFIGVLYNERTSESSVNGYGCHVTGIAFMIKLPSMYSFF